LSNTAFKTENGPNAINQNRPIDELDHSYGPGKHISDNLLEELALEIYKKYRRGITFKDIIENFHCKKEKAQRKLKNSCREYVNNGKKSSILFTLDNERTKPQQYFPSCIRATIIKNKRNRPIDPTGANYNNKASYPLYSDIENQIVQSFLFQLYLLPWQPLNMHNIHLWTIIDKSHYEEVKVKPAFNKTKIVRERIGLREVIYKLNKKGSIEIDISCSTKPFPIETDDDDDVNNFFIFLGKVQYTLAYILSDPRERIVPSVDKWILKSCDFNKDVEIQDKEIGQLLDLNIQVKHVGKAFRLYVKNLEDRFVLRKERTMNVNQPITTFLNDSILSPFHLINSKVTELINIVDKKLAEISNNIGNHKNK
jgi:hypothetical protein